MSNEKTQDTTPRINEEISDLEQRLNDLELEMVDAKEFSHITGDAFESLQNQIAELREMVETLLTLSTTGQERNESPVSEYQ